jgi:hypothetical protein
VDNQSWISIHVYIISDWERVPLLLSLERVIEGGSAESITKIILGALAKQGGLTSSK